MQISYRHETISFCQELVRRDSPSGQEGQIAEVVARQMSMLGYDPLWRDEVGNVIGVMRGHRPGRRVLLDAHMDVVPATSAESWRHPPFSAVLDKGYIWGRGSTDNKGPLAAVIMGVAALARSGGLCGEVAVAATVGEEMVEGFATARVLEGFDADYVVVCEPTEMRLAIGHKGRCGVIVSAEGLAAHSSQPERGINAVYRMMEAVRLVRELPLHEDERLGRGVDELVEIVSSPYPGTSMVPEGCTARFDRRLVRGETRDSVLAEMGAAVAAVEGVTVRYHRNRLRTDAGYDYAGEDFLSAWCMDPSDEIVGRAQAALRSVGQPDSWYTAGFCTNGAATAGDLALPTVVYGPGSISMAHVIDERMAVDDLLAGVEGYCALARALSEP
jgi:putative selenium metabolism hydrolase